MNENPFKNPNNPYPYGPPGGPGSPEPPKEPQPFPSTDWSKPFEPSMPAPYVPAGPGLPPAEAMRYLGSAASGDFVLNLLAIQKVQRLPYDPTPAGILPILKVPANLGIVLGVMIASHFILWNWKGARAFWHRRLAGAQLRQRGA